VLAILGTTHGTQCIQGVSATVYGTFTVKMGYSPFLLLFKNGMQTLTVRTKESPMIYWSCGMPCPSSFNDIAWLIRAVTLWYSCWCHCSYHMYTHVHTYVCSRWIVLPELNPTNHSGGRSIWKHAGTRGIWGHAPQENFKNKC